MSFEKLKSMIGKGGFWERLEEASQKANDFTEIVPLMTLRKRALKQAPPDNGRKLRVAYLGAHTIQPVESIVEHFLGLSGNPTENYVGGFDSVFSEIQFPKSSLYQFEPDVLAIFPRFFAFSNFGCGGVEEYVDQLLISCETFAEKSSAPIILLNLFPSPTNEFGQFRARSSESLWNTLRKANEKIQANCPSNVQICDVEFLAFGEGARKCLSQHHWFEAKQPFSPDFQLTISKHIAELIKSNGKARKKVLVLDLDNTLWGGVIGDDGVAGIELGDTSPKGEAFKDFQKYLKQLTKDGILLTVCSKNNPEIAQEPFKQHPEMILSLQDFVAFKANWEPKSQNIIEMANELNLGLEHFCFVDDNPAEIENVKQFAPEVSTLHLGHRPETFTTQLKEQHWFDQTAKTREDRIRTQLYKTETRRTAKRKEYRSHDDYLASLHMTAHVRLFREIDIPRIVQLINKSNQFNLTTIRRNERQIREILANPDYLGFTVRLKDRFGDYGLICVVILRCGIEHTEIDTWLMSCRVLNRGVEQWVMNEIVRRVQEKGYSNLRGRYLPTKRNSLVRELLPSMGFQCLGGGDGHFELRLESYSYSHTKIEEVQNDEQRNHPENAVNL